MTDSFSNPPVRWAAQLGDGREERVDRSSASASDSRHRTFEIQVELPSGPHNDYVYDAARHAFRLRAVVRPDQRLPGDCGALVGTLGGDGRPLPAVLLVSMPTLVGCLVHARLIGGLELPSGETRIVAVPEADPAFASVSGLEDLGAEQRQAIERLVMESGDESLSSSWHPRWLGLEEATEAVRQAQRAARLAAAANRKVGCLPAWQVVDPASRVARQNSEVLAHSEAEFSIRDLPLRFQEHVADCLQPEERILHFVRRPRMAVDSRLSLLRRRELNEGLLVVTDRQLLFMTDALPPDATLVDWGYLVVAVPVERLREATLVETGPTVRLEVEAQAGEGVEKLSMEFARSSLEACRRAAGLLGRFVPTAETRALRRLYEVKAAEVDLSAAVRLTGSAVLRRLEGLLAQIVLQGEDVLSRALAPAAGKRRSCARLLAVTGKRVLLLEDQSGSVAVVSSLDLGSIGSVELRYSILGSRLRVAAHMAGSARQLTLESETPGVFGPMVQSFRVLIPLLANQAQPSR